MSAFLGKIHYWLYNKIQLHEKLIEDIAEAAKKNGYDSEELLNRSFIKYGYPITGSLEENIEHSNIHGWLQERIISVESRLAYVVTELLNSNIIKKEEVSDIFYQNGVSTMKRLEVREGAPKDFFSLIFDYMLEGMPCDRVNEVVEDDENKIVWRTTSDIHKDYWQQVSGDVNNFNSFVAAWINGFLNESGTGYKYSREENGINIMGKE